MLEKLEKDLMDLKRCYAKSKVEFTWEYTRKYATTDQEISLIVKHLQTQSKFTFLRVYNSEGHYNFLKNINGEVILFMQNVRKNYCIWGEEECIVL